MIGGNDSISVGQKQQVAIARAMIGSPRMVILDEATSSVDPLTERLIKEATDNMMQNRTSFIIAHRLSTLRNATHLIVLDEGRLTESGTHEELMAKKGTYYKLNELQTKALAMRGLE